MFGMYLEKKHINVIFVINNLKYKLWCMIISRQCINWIEKGMLWCLNNVDSVEDHGKGEKIEDVVLKKDIDNELCI